MSTWSSINMNNSNSPLMEQLIFFHDNTMLILSMITMFILYIMIFLMKNKFINYKILENQHLELIWTIIPMILLIFIALPSIQILYLMDESNKPFITLKIIGNQWYWSYEYSDFKKINFDSFMINSPSPQLFRLLDTDNHIILPFKVHIRTLITSIDTIHAWTIPSLGLKMDAVPGRLNQMTFTSLYSGLFFGQCSEICGINHSFMPITLEIINFNSFLNWILNFS
uniref:Cytochrome c oxidase subunit 2 n=1 Tax=Macrostemum floridum TaxID=486976 RepID=A0A7L8XIE3_9NEOP|nr:cytochrome c oxidase subunit II [Macrostemum floridum]QOH91254.1 cytochrome c oxidase subunit 2 [Macrostemum floridum]